MPRLPQVTVLLELISDLLSVVGKGQGSKDEQAEQTINRQTALYSLKLLCHRIGPHHQEAFVPVLLRALEVTSAAHEEKNVTASALLCIAEVVSVLKALAIPQLPRFVSARCLLWPRPPAGQHQPLVCVLQADARRAAGAR